MSAGDTMSAPPTGEASRDVPVRIGLAYVSSLGEEDAERLVTEREANGPFRDVADLARRASVSQDALEALVRGGACDVFGPRRRDLLWELGSSSAHAAFQARAVRRSSSRSRSTRLPRRPTCRT